jgi:hypothetical protein
MDILWAAGLTSRKDRTFIKVAEKCKTMPFVFHVYGSPVHGTSDVK